MQIFNQTSSLAYHRFIAVHGNYSQPENRASEETRRKVRAVVNMIILVTGTLGAFFGGAYATHAGLKALGFMVTAEAVVAGGMACGVVACAVLCIFLAVVHFLKGDGSAASLPH